MRKVLTLVLSVLLLALATVPVLADGPDGDVVIWGDNYTLPSGQTIEGDLLVYGGNVVLEERSRVERNVTLFGGELDAAGRIDGDITVWGGNVTIRATATVRGQVLSVGGKVAREEGADVRGEEWEGLPFRTPRLPIPPRAPVVRTYRDWESRWLTNVGTVFRSTFGVIVLVVLGILVVVFIPRHTDTVAETLLKAPLQSFLTGLVAWVVVPIVAIVLAITICLSPVAALWLLVGGVALLFGWIAAGLLLGTRVMRAITKSEPNPVAAVAVGVLILSLLSFVPCLGTLMAAVVLTWSMGAVAYSFFGTRAYDEPPPKILSSTPGKDGPRVSAE
jgi:hypothetical protein